MTRTQDEVLSLQTKASSKAIQSKMFQKYVCMVLVQRIKFRFDLNFGLGSPGGRMTGFS